MNYTHNESALAKLVNEAYLEVIPTPSIMGRLQHLQPRSYISITCSPTKGLEPTLDLMEQLRSLPENQQLKLVPHIAARLVKDKGHLREIMARLAEARVESVFVPGGDSAEPVGAYSDSLELLRDMAEIGHDIEDVGIAAHPEGHPSVSDDKLLWFLKEKQDFATYLVTQMCFNPQVLVNWLRGTRRAGVHLPAWIGLPGVADITKLISLSLRIGVGQSVKTLRKQNGLFTKLMRIKPYQPDDLITGLAPLVGDPEMNVPGFHLFSFNDVERTEKWRTESSNYSKVQK